MTYRADIDGLRALAIVLVVVFHAKLDALSGGFIGVDVFFVISGYLIASNIATDAAKGEFSVAQFYARRARRILPALFLVLFVSSIAALYFLILPQDLETFARSARAALLFYSNFFFSRSGDYFGPALETQPLLHTWSLGVEEQFYLIAPLLLAPLMTSTRTRPWVIFAAVLVLFVFLSQYGVLRGGSKAFYWPHTRAFELMIGVAMASPLLKPLPRRATGFASAAGMTMIMLAALTFTEKTAFPGFAALLPTVGAALLIWSGRSGPTFIGRALSMPFPVFLGKISYPLYLWHWPIFVFAGLLPVPLVSPLDRIGLIALAIACATATYYLLELPIRRHVRTDALQRPFIFKTAATAAIVCLLPLEFLIWSEGWSDRFGPEVARFTRENPISLVTPGLCAKSSNLLSADCMIGDAAAPSATFVLWGDSHGRMIAPTISEIAKTKGLKGYFVAQGGCEPLIIPESVRLPIKCREATERLFRYLSDARIERVILIGRWAGYYVRPTNGKDAKDLIRFGIPFAQALPETVNQLISGNRELILIGPVPEPLFNVPLAMTRALINGQSTSVSIPRSAFNERNDEILKVLAQVAAQDRVRLIYPHLIFCDDQKCDASEDGRALYVDNNHLSPRGAAKLNSVLSTIFPAFAESNLSR